MYTFFWRTLCIYIYIYIYIFLYEKKVRKIPWTPLSITLHTVCASFQTRTVATTLLYTPRTSPDNIFSADGRSCGGGHMAPMIGILWYWEGSWCLTVDQSKLLIWFWLLYLREISIRFGYRKIVKRETGVLTDLMKPDIRSAMCLLLNAVETKRFVPRWRKLNAIWWWHSVAVYTAGRNGNVVLNL